MSKHTKKVQLLKKGTQKILDKSGIKKGNFCISA